MSGPEVAKAIGVQVTEAKPDPNKNLREFCHVRLVYEVNAWSETLGERSDEAVSGVGEEAHYQEGSGVFVKIGAKDRLTVAISLGLDYRTKLQKSTERAKVVVPKL